MIKYNKYLIYFTLIVFLIICIIITKIILQERAGWTPRKINRVLAGAPLPGSTRSEVQSWLASYGLRTSWVSPLGVAGFGEGAAEEAGVDPNEVGVALITEVPNFHVDVFGSNGSAIIVAFFNKNNKLIKIHARIWKESM